MAKQLTGPRLNYMQKRLKLMHLGLAQGYQPTVAQISACYSSMAINPSNHDDATWASLLQLCQHAVGVLDICRLCNGTGMVSGKRDPQCPFCNASHYCKCTEPNLPDVRAIYLVPKGFQRVPCAKRIQGMVVGETCQGSGWLRVHKPAPGELQHVDRFSAELGTRGGTTDVMQRVAAVLQTMCTR